MAKRIISFGNLVTFERVTTLGHAQTLGMEANSASISEINATDPNRAEPLLIPSILFPQISVVKLTCEFAKAKMISDPILPMGFRLVWFPRRSRV